jgi:hypothetical protein
MLDENVHCLQQVDGRSQDFFGARLGVGHATTFMMNKISKQAALPTRKSQGVVSISHFLWIIFSVLCKFSYTISSEIIDD